jgi:hypothetical protein
MEPSSRHSAFRGTVLRIESFRDLPEVLTAIESGSSLASQITAIEVMERELDESELDRYPQVIAPEGFEQFGTDISKIIQDIQQYSVLEKFTWVGVDDKNTRPAAFWEALCKSSTTLKSLNIEFSVHELAKLSKLVSY